MKKAQSTLKSVPHLKSNVGTFTKHLTQASSKAAWVALCILCMNACTAFALSHEDRKTMAGTLTASVNRLREAADLQYPDNGVIGISSTSKVAKANKLMAEGISLSHSVSDEFLDWLCPGLKTAYRDHCIKGAIIFLEGMKENSLEKQYSGIQISRPWLDFYERYGPTIGEKLQTFCR